MEKITSDQAFDLSISVVSHSQIDMVTQLLEDLAKYCTQSSFEVILTLNLPEELPWPLAHFPYSIKLIRNTTPQGFGANHNQAFTHANGLFFCVINPDIRFMLNPFPDLMLGFKTHSTAMVAPLVLGFDGKVEDSTRRFPSPFKIACKVFRGCKGSDYLMLDKPYHPDWAAGMFQIFKNAVFAELHGFDDRYFLYYEDVDICARLKLLGYQVLVDPKVKVTHHAQRSSHRSLKYLRWHLTSMIRFFMSPVYWRLQLRQSQ